MMRRERFEQEIIQCEKVFHCNVHILCTDDTILGDFMTAWNRLVYYYETVDDRQISVEMIRVYMETRHFLQGMSLRMDLSEACRLMAKEAFLRLDSFMTDITHIIDRRLYPNEW
jgi:hypothetical protein